MNIYDVEYQKNSGEVSTLSEFKDKTILVVNTASRCGFTKQYADLENLYKKNSANLEIIAFPCNQFGEQEPGTDEEIINFCKNDYNISFTVAKKTEVNGHNAHPLYLELRKAINGQEISWNFEKFIIKNGNIKHFLSNYIPTKEDL